MDEALANRLYRYARQHQVQIGELLGSGHQGAVFVAQRSPNLAPFALKIHKAVEPFQREWRAYDILRENQVTQLEGLYVPQFLRADDEFLVIEMTIVDPPFLLDFGGAYDPDEVPDFPQNVWEEWRQQKQEEFGGRWPEVEKVLAILRMMDIFMLDIHPRNLTFSTDSR